MKSRVIQGMFIKKVGGVCEVPCDPGNELRRWEGFVCESLM